ncbi:MAG: hypothetical protein FWG74_01305 [Planctomycetes bacterium]|nr:hypothetical protein [Planctomycetota bacterium]
MMAFLGKCVAGNNIDREKSTTDEHAMLRKIPDRARGFHDFRMVTGCLGLRKQVVPDIQKEVFQSIIN